jgi:hypothetical protein
LGAIVVVVCCVLPVVLLGGFIASICGAGEPYEIPVLVGAAAVWLLYRSRVRAGREKSVGTRYHR